MQSTSWKQDAPRLDRGKRSLWFEHLREPSNGQTAADNVETIELTPRSQVWSDGSATTAVPDVWQLLYLFVVVDQCRRQQRPFGFPEMFVQCRPADVQFSSEVLVRYLSGPVVVPTVKGLSDDLSLSGRQWLVVARFELLEPPEGHSSELLEVLDNGFEIRTPKDEDIVDALAASDRIRTAKRSVVLVDSRVRTTGRFGDEEVVRIESIDVLDVVSIFEFPLKRIGVAPGTENERDDAVLQLFDLDRERIVDLRGEPSKNALPLLCEVEGGDEHSLNSDRLCCQESKRCVPKVDLRVRTRRKHNISQ